MITEATINREVNVRGGLMMGGYRTSDKTNGAFIKTGYFMAEVRSKLKEQVNLLSSCVHKELSPGSRKYHENIVTYNKEKIVILFLNAPAHHLKTGVEIDVNMMSTQIYYHTQRLGLKCLLQSL